MKRLFKRSISAFLALIIALGCLGMTAFAEEVVISSGDWKYTVNDDGKSVTVSALASSDSSVEIPSAVRQGGVEYTVTAVADDVAKDNTALTTLKIGKNIASIGKNAFSGCTNLETVKVSSTLTLGENAFSGSKCNKVFSYSFQKNEYSSKTSAEVELKSVFGDGISVTWNNGNIATWSSGTYTVKTNAAVLGEDKAAPSVTLTIGDYSWKSAASPKDVYLKSGSKAVLTVSDKGDPASGIKSVEYFFNENPISDPANKEHESEWVAFPTADDKYERPISDDEIGIFYIRVMDNDGNATYINSDKIAVDKTGPEVKLISKTADPDITYPEGVIYGTVDVSDKASNNFDQKYTSSVEIEIDAEDDGIGVDAIYYTVRYGNNVGGYSNYEAMHEKSSSWEKLDGTTISVAGDGNTFCIVYVKVVDEIGNFTYASTEFFKPGDDIAPVITGVYYKNGEKKEVTFKNGDSIKINSGIMLSASDDSEELEYFNSKEEKSTKTVTMSSLNYILAADGKYTVTAADESDNTTVITVEITRADTKAPEITLSGWVSGKETDTAVENGKTYTYNHPVTMKVTDAALAYVTSTYTEKDDEGEDVEKTEDIGIAAAKNYIFSDYNTYKITVVDDTFNKVEFTLTISDTTRSITGMTVDTGSGTDNTQLTCLGGSFKATVSGSNIYHKLAVFNGTTLVGSVLTIGSAEKPMDSVELESGKIALPANKTDSAVEYVIRYYDVDTKDEDITSTTGTELKKITVAKNALSIIADRTSAEFTAEGGKVTINFVSNFLPLVSTSIPVSDCWTTFNQPKTEVNDADGTVSFVFEITAPANTGLKREFSMKFYSSEDASAAVTINVTQAGVGEVERLSGAGRVETAIAISKSGWTSAKTVVLAGGNGFADALAGVPLAAAADGPILLTMNKSTGIESAVLDEIKRLGATKVYVLGGSAVISEQICDEIEDESITVTRISGKDRYATSVAIAKELAFLTNKDFTKLYFTNAWNYPDALSVSAAAGIEGNPILYMPTKGAVETNVEEYLKTNKCTTGVIIGGTGAVSDDGKQSLEKFDLTVTRIFGADRYATSVKINETYKDLFTGKAVAVATGTNYPDALAGGVLCAKLKYPVVLVAEGKHTDAAAFIKSETPEKLVVFGGTSAVSNELAITLVSAK